MADIHEFIKPASKRIEIDTASAEANAIRALHDPSPFIRSNAMRVQLWRENQLRVMVEDAAVHNGDEAFLPKEAASGGLVRLVFFIVGAVIGVVVGVML